MDAKQEAFLKLKQMAEKNRAVSPVASPSRTELPKPKEKKPIRKELTAEDLAKALERRRAENEALNRQIDEANSKIVCENMDIKTKYARIRKSVELVALGYLNCAFIQGRAGTGKSYQITAKLNEMGKKSGQDYIEFSGEISEAYLYRFIYENNGKLIIFRDLSSLLNGLKSVNMLKGMTETHGTRIIRKAVYSRDDDLPLSFECKSNFVFEFNNMHFNGMREDVEALFSRGDYINIVLSFDDIKSLMKEICKDDREKEITRFIQDNYSYVGMNALNLRTQNKAFRICDYAEKEGRDWRTELELFLKGELSEIRRMLYTLMGDRVVRSGELKAILVRSQIDGISHLRTADRRIHDWVLLQELHITGQKSEDEEVLEQYMNTHRNYAVCINPVEATQTTQIPEIKCEAVEGGI